MTENEAIKRIIKSACASKKCHDACLYGEGNCEYDAAIIALKEVQRYREIGTVEECREAVEKQKAREPRDIEHDYSYFVCDNCGEGIYVSDDFESHHYCLNCGQAIQWDEDLEETEDEL